MCQDSVEYPSTMILLPDLPNLIYRTFKLRAQKRIHSVNRKFVLIYRYLNNKDGQNVSKNPTMVLGFCGVINEEETKG